MTSEVLLMNKSAAAMAADSAVTIGNQHSHTIYQSVDKVFQLSPGMPVGIMIYNHAEIMNVPWETIITLYQRERKGKRFDTIEEYGEDFLAFIEKHKELFPRDHQDLEYFKTVAIIFGLIAEEFERELEHFRTHSDENPSAHTTAIFEFILGEIHGAYHHFFDGTPREDLECFPGNMGDSLRKRYAKQVQELIESLRDHLCADYPEITFSENTIELLKDIAVLAVTKNAFFEGYTGIVIAGFGAKDKFPSMISYHTGGIFEGRLKKALDRKAAVDANSGPVIMTFAQDKMIYTFMTGMDRDFRTYLFIETLKMTHQLVADVVASVPGLSREQKQELYERYSEEHLSHALMAFFQAIDYYQQQVHTLPIFQAVHTLPRKELAETAASLVTLNSFQQKVMQQPETVGGPVDVALISLAEGFELIKG